MKVGILGGTFDPIHLGHLIAAERVREDKHLDEVWFIPSYQPPHKEDAPKASGAQRWEMICTAIKQHPYFRAKDVELKRGGASYTINTVKELLQQHPDKQFYYIIGADMVQYLPHWHRIDELLQHAAFIGLQRPGYTIHWNELSEAIHNSVSMVSMPLIEISATEIRQRCSRSQSIRYLVHDLVRDYIEENQLYES